ncbi:hypothetical protein D3C81_2077680 [compost metagenome]
MIRKMSCQRIVTKVVVEIPVTITQVSRMSQKMRMNLMNIISSSLLKTMKVFPIARLAISQSLQMDLRWRE